MTDDQADQIALLLNARNQLMGQYARQRVIEHAANYIYRLSESGEVAPQI